VAAGGRVEVSADWAQPVQLVDSRDLARLVTRLLEDGRGGPLFKTDWATQHRSSARARAAGMPVTPIGRTGGDVWSWLSES
jgi:2'-hydroxyisoflavone reductase